MLAEALHAMCLPEANNFFFVCMEVVQGKSHSQELLRGKKTQTKKQKPKKTPKPHTTPNKPHHPKQKKPGNYE